MYQVPQSFREQLERIDPNLRVEWDVRRCLWNILRKSPLKPLEPPRLVLTVCEPGGAYRPLDNRAIWRLRDMDVYRRFDGRQEKHIGKMVEQELRDREAALSAEKKKATDEKHAEIMDRMRFNVAKWTECRSYPKVRFAR